MKEERTRREPVNMKKIKEAEIREKEEEIKELKKELADFSEYKIPARVEEDLEVDQKTTENSETREVEQIKKLKCNYEIFKNERNKSKMRVPEHCEICKNKFKDNAPIYVALDKKLNQIFVCEKCAEDNQQKTLNNTK